MAKVSILLSFQKKADELHIIPEELSVWGVRKGQQHVCVMEAKETGDETEFFICEIPKIPDTSFQQLMVNLCHTAPRWAIEE